MTTSADYCKIEISEQVPCSCRRDLHVLFLSWQFLSKNCICAFFFLFQTQKTVFEARTEKRCDIHFKKECWIDYKEQSKSQTIHVCTTKPERKCDLTAAEKEAFGKTECNTYYETVSGIFIY